MSDEDRDVDIESDEDDEDGLSLSQSATHFMTPAERRAHHNALERKRRDHIKESFTSLRDSVPNLQGEKVKVSRAQILKKAAEYITFMRRKNHSHQQDIDDLKRHNNILEQQIKSLEKAKTTGQFAVSGSVSARSGTLGHFDELESDSEENNATVAKKLKLSS